jgi:hypothetical protein
MKRLTVLMPPELYDRLVEQGKKESRKNSNMAIERGLPDPESAMSYQAKVAEGLVKKKQG